LDKLSEKDDLSWIEYNGKELTKNFLQDYKIFALKSKLISNEFSKKGLDAIKKGFTSIELKKVKEKLTPYELQEVLCGVQVHHPQELWNQWKVDLNDWRRDLKTIELTTQEYRSLLKWMTGLMSLPVHGLSKKISIFLVIVSLRILVSQCYLLRCEGDTSSMASLSVISWNVSS
jgi:hypothetical protein